MKFQLLSYGHMPSVFLIGHMSHMLWPFTCPAAREDIQVFLFFSYSCPADAESQGECLGSWRPTHHITTHSGYFKNIHITHPSNFQHLQELGAMNEPAGGKKRWDDAICKGICSDRVVTLENSGIVREASMYLVSSSRLESIQAVENARPAHLTIG